MKLTRAAGLAAILLLAATGAVRADGSGDPKPVSEDAGKYMDKDGNPTFNIKDGKVDFYTYIGYVRYAANCLQCHGPDGLGSTYAPSLVNSLQHLSYPQFMATVAGGKKDVSAAQTLVMPSLGTNKNVMCYIDAIYVYLRARSDGALDRERPKAHEPKPKGFQEAEDSCMG
ncbi:c-type cytochrome, methanol metabolism-related [Acidisphaera rubrifaciens]|uniref:Cytochrome c-553i n=1 Tax=Acidisphaera rubrifaciens HS-AP3 TaxID=1231350 RepID=A0A0D6P4T2_9PROT|nr:c-type cytochrome, methanol metabolism-related [Acidisphaera rubrifaciens]GAN76198.1 cytochrome c-553i [Acidisphaera rubrifaciens HS-AP3]